MQGRGREGHSNLLGFLTLVDAVLQSPISRDAIFPTMQLRRYIVMVLDGFGKSEFVVGMFFKKKLLHIQLEYISDRNDFLRRSGSVSA